MKSLTQFLLMFVSLVATLHAGEAMAHTHAEPSAPRFARWVASHPHYPLGSPDFYYQFAGDRIASESDSAGIPEALSGGDSVGTLGAMTVRAGEEWIDDLGASSAPAPRANTEATEEQHDSPASRLALPVAALGLMLFVARRRTRLP